MAVKLGNEIGNRTVLLVEDEQIIRVLLAEVLEAEGYAVIAYPDADQALSYLSSHSGSLALVLTDVNMPGLHNGVDLANMATVLWPWLPIIVMSGLQPRESAALSEGVAFIQKPFPIDQILALIDSTLR